jgi:DNA-binding winged helix-turn-helix (wHTH) protein
MQTLARWIEAGESGSVVGLIGCGRSTLLGFLCNRPDVLENYLTPRASPVALIAVDIYNLPTNDLSSLYRTILHAFYWVRERFAPALQTTITELYLENRAIQDPFLPQMALYELLQHFQEQQIQVVLVLNRFDHFCQTATPQMINTLRGLRDSFKDTLCYFVGMLQDAAYLPDSTALGDMYQLLDSRVCWVSAMNEADARYMLGSVLHTAHAAPTEAEIAAMLALSGRFPYLLKEVGTWWLTTPNRPTAPAEWLEILLAKDSIQYRLERMWNGLTQEEQLALAEIQALQAQARLEAGSGDIPPKQMSWKLTTAFQNLAKRQRYALNRLAAKGLCYPAGDGWGITGELLAAYVARIEVPIRGRVWLDEKAKVIYQGQEPIQGLAGISYEILKFLIKNPRVKHSHDIIINSAWPEAEQRAGITTNALQVHIASLRKIIEPNPAKPRYLITWHGRPGGYQFFPEGRPE